MPVVAFVLRTDQPRVRISMLPNFLAPWSVEKGDAQTGKRHLNEPLKTDVWAFGGPIRCRELTM